jgi:hypothetical protein
MQSICIPNPATVHTKRCQKNGRMRGGRDNGGKREPRNERCKWLDNRKKETWSYTSDAILTIGWSSERSDWCLDGDGKKRKRMAMGNVNLYMYVCGSGKGNEERDQSSFFWFSIGDLIWLDSLGRFTSV